MKRVYKVVNFILLISFISLSIRLDLFGEEISSKRLNQTKKEITPAREFQRLLRETEELLEEIEEGKTENYSRVRENRAKLNQIAIQLEEEFKRTRSEIISKNLPEEIIRRHDEFVKEFEEKLSLLLNNLDEIEKTKGEARIKKIKIAKEFIKANLPKPKHTPLDPNKLPHRRQEIKTREPITDPKEFKKKYPELTKNTKKPILLASTSNTFPITDPNLSETPEVQFTDEIKELAASLEYNPVKIYEWVRNNIEFVPYYGSLQGSQMTLWTLKGNDFDQASLLISLLRVSNIPARYVYGVIEIPIEKAMTWVGGVKEEYLAPLILQSCGIPTTAVISGGKISKIRIEHCWVEAYVKYIPYRGAVVDSGDTWVPLDPSFKQYNYKDGIDISSICEIDPDGFFNQVKTNSTVNESESYVTNVNSQVVIEQLQQWEQNLTNYIDQNLGQGNVKDITGYKEIIPQRLNILPASLPYGLKTVLGKFSEIPDGLRHKVTFTLLDYSAFSPVSFTYQIKIPELSGRKIGLYYQAASSQDVQVIESYGDIFNVPAYLVHVKPVFVIESEEVIAGSPTNLGNTQTFKIEFISPTGQVDISEKKIISGAYSTICIDLVGISDNFLKKRQEKIRALKNYIDNQTGDTLSLSIYDTGGELSYNIGLNYFSFLDTFSQIAGLINGIYYSRQPSIGFTDINLAPEYLYGIPYSISFEGIGIDVIRDVSFALAKDGDQNKTKCFMEVMGIVGSDLEHAVLEFYGIPSVSATKILREVSNAGIPIYRIDATNISQIISKLQISEQIKIDIQNAVNTGKVVIVPEQEITINQWHGAGYIILDPNTGAGAYLISGGIAGGSSSVPPWTYYSLWKTVYSCVVALGKTLNLGMFEIDVLSPVLSGLLIVTGSAVSFINIWTSDISELDKISKSLLVLSMTLQRAAWLLVFIQSNWPILGVTLLGITIMWILDKWTGEIYKFIESRSP